MTREQLLELASAEIHAKRREKMGGGKAREANDDGDNGDDDDDLPLPPPQIRFEEQVPAEEVAMQDGEGEGEGALGTSVQWTYKWVPAGEVFGPYSSEQMNAWADQGYFGDGVLVKKEGTEDYMSSKRVDFSLFIDD